MRRIPAALTVLVACLLALPATAHAAPAPIGGGSVLFPLSGTPRCTAAFAATAGPAGYLVTGPGCAGGLSVQLYSGSNVLVGPTTASSTGYSIVHVTNTAAWQLVPWIDYGAGTVTITGSTPTPVGSSVCLLDRVTGKRCGVVTAVNQTVDFPGGPVTGLTRTNICVAAGNGPIAYVSGTQAQGVPIGGAGSCGSGGSSFFTPVNRILTTYGLALLTG
jgi:streptogrisin C